MGGWTEDGLVAVCYTKERLAHGPRAELRAIKKIITTVEPSFQGGRRGGLVTDQSVTERDG